MEDVRRGHRREWQPQPQPRRRRRQHSVRREKKIRDDAWGTGVCVEGSGEGCMLGKEEEDKSRFILRQIIFQENCFRRPLKVRLERASSSASRSPGSAPRRVQTPTFVSPLCEVPRKPTRNLLVLQPSLSCRKADRRRKRVRFSSQFARKFSARTRPN